MTSHMTDHMTCCVTADCETCDYSITMSTDEPPTYKQAKSYPVSSLKKDPLNKGHLSIKALGSTHTNTVLAFLLDSTTSCQEHFGLS